MKIPVHTRYVLIVLSLLMLAPAWLPAQSERPEPAPAADAPGDEGGTTVHWAGMKIAIDPETGRLQRPSESQRQALRESFERVFGRLQELEEARSAAIPAELDGMRVKPIMSRHFNFSVYHAAHEEARCVSGTAQLEALLSATAEATRSER